jgi:phospholipase C
MLTRTRTLIACTAAAAAVGVAAGIAAPGLAATPASITTTTLPTVYTQSSGQQSIPVPGGFTAGGGRGVHGSLPARTASPIQHVVVIYLENHSFDSVLGFWCDANPGRCPQGGMPSSVTLSDGTVISPSVAKDTVPPVRHDVAAQLTAIDGGKMDGWQNIPAGGCDAATGYQCVSGYQPQQVPNLTGLASRFAISDNTFSLHDSASWTGHMDIVAGGQDHFLGNNPYGPFPPVNGWGCDSGLEATWITSKGTGRAVPSCVPDPSLNPSLYPYGGAFEATPARYMPTIMDRLGASGLSWRIYGATQGEAGYGVWDICPTFAECLHTGQYANLVDDAQFITDASSGTLPSFSLVTPGGSEFLSSCHNNTSMTACDNWLGQLMTPVMSGPEWSSTAVFITFDDCGCFYDQVPPPLDPAGQQEGPRVPLIIVSPYARPGFTDTAQTTFGGILDYTEDNFGLAVLGTNDGRAYDFMNAFNYAQAPLKPMRMVRRPLPASAERIRLTPALEYDPT